MLVALAYHQGDQDQAQRLIDWISDLGGFGKHRLLLCRELKAQPLKRLPQTIEHITFNDVYSHWPISTSLAFSTVARHIEYNTQESFLWIEPDVVPLRAGWLDAIADEVKHTSKKFIGALVPEYMGTPAHMSGIGVWPGQLSYHAGPALMLDERVPFDLMAIDMIYPQCHFTDRIVHRWDRPARPSVSSMEEIYQVVTTEAVLFHGNKDGSWIETLRGEKRSVSGSVETVCVVEPGPATSISPNGNKEPQVGAELVGFYGDQFAEVQMPDGSRQALKLVATPIEMVKARFVSPLAKARIMKQLKAAPIIKELKAVGLQPKKGKKK